MTLLNTADALYLGDTPVRRVYLGDTLVWQPPLERLIALAGTRGAIWIVGVSPAWQDADRTVPAGDGDPVLVIDDLSGNDYHWIAPNDPARPVLVSADGYWHLLFDGVDDHMTCPSFGTPSWPHDGSGATLGMAVDDIDMLSNNRNIFVTSQINNDSGLSIHSSGTTNVYFRLMNGETQSPVDYRAINVLLGNTANEIRLIRAEHGLDRSPNWQTHTEFGIAPASTDTGDYAYPPAAVDTPARSVPRLMTSVNNQPVSGRWHGGCLLPVTGHGALVDDVLQAHMPPILEPSP